MLEQQGLAPAPTMAGALDPQVPQPVLPPGGNPGGFTGQINVGGDIVQVRGGVVSYEGAEYIVSDDGQYVVDLQQRLVGVIQNGQFVPATPEIVDQLRQQGIFEDEQPAGIPPQA